MITPHLRLRRPREAPRAFWDHLMDHHLPPLDVPEKTEVTTWQGCTNNLGLETSVL